MYRIYETEGIIVKSSPKSETGALYLILTKNMGLIRATAQGVRSSKSKLRHFLVDLKPALFYLVRGREVWRITNVKEIEETPKLPSSKLIVLARVLKLVCALVHGEEKDERLFDLIHGFYKELHLAESGEIRALEEISVLRLLFILGYVESSPTLSMFTNVVKPASELVETFLPVRREAIGAINNALKASQL